MYSFGRPGHQLLYCSRHVGWRHVCRSADVMAPIFIDLGSGTSTTSAVRCMGKGKTITAVNTATKRSIADQPRRIERSSVFSVVNFSSSCSNSANFRSCLWRGMDELPFTCLQGEGSVFYIFNLNASLQIPSSPGRGMACRRSHQICSRPGIAFRQKALFFLAKRDECREGPRCFMICR